MKKTIVLLAATVLFSATVSAQSLGSLLGSVANNSGSAAGILNGVSKVVQAYTGNTKAVNLLGNWTYTGSAFNLGSDNALTNVAGTAVSAGMETKVNEYLQKVGIREGSMTFTFNEDLTFTCTVLGIPLGGTWKTLEDGNKVQLQFGKVMKYMSMTGTLQGTVTGCQMLFEGNKFLSFIKTALSVVGKQSGTASTISSLAGNYNNMQIGWNLRKN